MFQVTLGWIDRWLGIYKIKVRNLRYYFSRLLRLPRSCFPRLYQICYCPPWLLRPLRLCWQHLLHPQCCLQWKINNVTLFFRMVYEHVYRVPHCKMYLFNWLWRIEICKLDFDILRVNIFRHYNDFIWNSYCLPSIGPDVSHEFRFFLPFLVKTFNNL